MASFTHKPAISTFLLVIRVALAAYFLHAGYQKIAVIGTTDWYVGPYSIAVKDVNRYLEAKASGAAIPKPVDEAAREQEWSEVTLLTRHIPPGVLTFYGHAYPYAQVVVGLCLLVGLLTRFSALLVLGLLLSAGWALTVQPHPSGGRILFGQHYYLGLMFLALLALIFGAGRVSVDTYLRRALRRLRARVAGAESAKPQTA